MTPEVIAEWLLRQGHKVVRTKSSYWFNQGPRVYQAFPYHWVIQPTEDELLAFLIKENAVGLRYSTPPEAEEGSCSYHVVYERPTYELKDVDSSIRGQVRRGLEACKVTPISLERYAKEGWLIEQDTQMRQHRHSRRGQTQWERMVGATVGLEGFSVWGAEVEGRLAATLMFAQVDDCVDLLYQQSLREFLPLRVNNALLFETTKALVARPDIRLIHNGLHSLDAPARVDQFKVRHGYCIKPLRQRVVFHPRLAPLFNSNTSAILARIVKLFPESESLQKTSGLMRFYCNGKLPLALQDFPEIFSSSRSTLIIGQIEQFQLTSKIHLQDGKNAQIPSSTSTTLTAIASEYRMARLSDISEIVRVHRAAFPDFFMTALGPRFLRSYYLLILSYSDQVFWVKEGNCGLEGFVSGFLNPVEFYKRLKSHRLQLALAILHRILARPWLVLRLKASYTQVWRSIREEEPEACELSSIAVDPSFSGKGIGQGLAKAFVEATRGRAVSIVLTTDAIGNDGVNHFYQKFGFVLDGSYERSRGRIMNKYRYPL